MLKTTSLPKYDTIQHTTKQWSYLVDPTHVPEYLLIRLAGQVPIDVAIKYRQSVIECYRQMVVEGDGHCPVVVDYSLLDSSDWSVAQFAKIHGGLFGRTHRFVAIPSQILADHQLQGAFIGFAQMLWKNVTLVGDLDEALTHIRMR